jgi:hypothetical protein
VRFKRLPVALQRSSLSVAIEKPILILPLGLVADALFCAVFPAGAAVLRRTPQRMKRKETKIKLLISSKLSPKI